MSGGSGSWGGQWLKTESTLTEDNRCGGDVMRCGNLVVHVRWVFVGMLPTRRRKQSPGFRLLDSPWRV